MALMSRFSTQDLPSGMRFQVWRDRLCRSFGEMSASSPSSAEFVAWSEVWTEGDIVLCRMHVDPQCLERAPDRATAPRPGGVHAVFPLAGKFHIQQAGREVLLEPGDWGLYDPSMGFRSVSHQPVDLLVLIAPRSTMLGHGISFDRCSTRRFSSESGSARVAKNYLASVLEERAALHPLTSPEFAAVAAQLVHLSVMESVGRQSEVSLRALSRARIQSYVTRNLRNPDLSIETIAAVHRCSKRYVHKIFAGEGETLSDYIRRLRLENCRRELSSPQLSHLSVTEIAFSWGFQHQGHFSRVFRERFTVSPSCCRPATAASSRCA